MFKMTLIRSLFTLFKAVFFSLLLVASTVSYCSSAFGANSPLENLLGTPAYTYLRTHSGFSESKWRYFELIALKISVVESLQNEGSFSVEWDDVYISQNNILNNLTSMAPLAEGAMEYLEVIANERDDQELVETAKAFLVELEEAMYGETNELLQSLWNIALPHASGSVILEVSPPENYSESPIANGALARFYMNLAESNGWSYEILSIKENNRNAGALVEGGQPLGHAYIRIRGANVYRHLFLENGTHRFIYTDDHKIGNTTRNGGTHTSYSDVRVYVMPRSSRFLFRESDVEFQFSRSSGAGGQHVNTTDSAVRATHRPTGLSVYVQQERSQHQNRRVAVEMLKAKVFTQHLEQQQTRQLEARDSGLIQSTRTSPYVRTYNLLRDPVETRSLLRGQSRPNNYDAWEMFLAYQLDLLSLDLTGEIEALISQMPGGTELLLTQRGYMTSNPESTSINGGSGTCRSILNP